MVISWGGFLMKKEMTYEELVECIEKKNRTIGTLKGHNKRLKNELARSESDVSRLRQRLNNGKVRKRLSETDLIYYHRMGWSAAEIADEYDLKEKAIAKKIAKINGLWG